MELVPPDSPLLRQRSAQFTQETREMHLNTIQQLREMVGDVGAVGLAFCQIGIPLYGFVTQIVNFPVVLNPTWKPVGDDRVSKQERCVNRMNFVTFVRRPARIYAIWEDEDGFRKSRLLEKDESRVFQHLCDLCDGKPIWV